MEAIIVFYLLRETVTAEVCSIPASQSVVEEQFKPLLQSYLNNPHQKPFRAPQLILKSDPEYANIKCKTIVPLADLPK